MVSKLAAISYSGRIHCTYVVPERCFYKCATRFNLVTPIFIGGMPPDLSKRRMLCMLSVCLVPHFVHCCNHYNLDHMNKPPDSIQVSAQIILCPQLFRLPSPLVLLHMIPVMLVGVNTCVIVTLVHTPSGSLCAGDALGYWQDYITFVSNYCLPSGEFYR